MNLLVGFEKWVKTLPIKFASWAFAFKAILVPFTARHSFWLFFFLCNRYSTENRQKDVAFFFVVFGRASPEFEKWVNSRLHLYCWILQSQVSFLIPTVAGTLMISYCCFERGKRNSCVHEAWSIDDLCVYGREVCRLRGSIV